MGMNNDPNANIDDNDNNEDIYDDEYENEDDFLDDNVEDYEYHRRRLVPIRQNFDYILVLPDNPINEYEGLPALEIADDNDYEGLPALIDEDNNEYEGLPALVDEY